MGSPLCCTVRSLPRSWISPCPKTGPVLSVIVSGNKTNGIFGDRLIEET
jgi:hypothetical protein